MESLHKLNIIHRDIKPANVFLTAQGHIVLGDFGFSKSFPAPGYEFSFDADPKALSGSFDMPSADALAHIARDVCGTLSWMSPAQHAGTAYSYDADTWSLGLLLFWMRTGRVSFAFISCSSHSSIFSLDAVRGQLRGGACRLRP